jgi:hypothetical protein
VMLLKIAQAAESLGISPKHFRREFVNTGAIEVISLGKSAKGDRIHPENLDRLIDSRRETRCYTNEAISGGLSSSPKVKLFNDPLGLPARGKRKP